MFNKILKSKEKQEAEIYGKQTGEIKKLVKEFFETKLISLDVPVELVKEAAPELLRALISVYMAQSTQSKEYLAAKEKFNLTNIKDLEVKEFKMNIDQNE